MEILRQAVEAEELKLRLRRTQEAHDELNALDQQKREVAEQARKQAHAEQLAQQQAEREAREQARREQRRRAIIQEVAHQALSDNVGAVLWAFSGDIGAAEEVEAQAAIERRLSALDVEGIPKGRLLAMAQAIRDEIYGAARQRREAVREKRRQEEREVFAQIGQTLREGVRVGQEAARQSAEQIREQTAQAIEGLTKVLSPSPEDQARRREREEAERRERRKRELVAYGKQYASEELDEEGIRPGLERFSILRRVEQALTGKLTGTESRAKVEALVGEILDEELGE